MPITREDFEKGEPIVALEQAILALLNADRLAAYTSSEISSLLHSSSRERVEQVLETLIAKGSISGKMIGDFRHPYYAAP